MQNQKPKSAVKTDIWSPAHRRRQVTEKRLAKLTRSALVAFAAFNSLTGLEDSMAGLHNLPENGVVRSHDNTGPLTTIPLSILWNARINMGIHELRTRRHIQICTPFHPTDSIASALRDKMGDTAAGVFLIARAAIGMPGTIVASLFNGLTVGVAETASQGAYGNAGNPCATPVGSQSVYGTDNFYFPTAMFDGGPRL